MMAVDNKITEREKSANTLIGGPLLHGNELKQFVSNLREKNLLYREYKAHLQAMTAELGVLTRTLDIVKSLQPSEEQEKVNKDSSKMARYEYIFCFYVILKNDFILTNEKL